MEPTIKEEEKEEDFYNVNYVSNEQSIPEDKSESEQIEKILKEDFNLFESREESRKREEVLNKINSIVKQAIKNLAIKKGLSEEESNEVGGKIFTFGSYRLGIVGPGDDIDVLCVGPNHADRKEFFDEMKSLFEKEKEKEKEITELIPIPDARVPIIKIIFSGIHIDILVAKLNLKKIDDSLNSLQDDNLLKNCSKECILSLNGCRVTNTILSLVPNDENFRLTLRAIKLWAKKRGIYSNALGYPGGVAWAILVAKICKMFPGLKPNKLIKRFFEIYSKWDWDKPVQINEIKKEVDFSCPIEVWKEDKKTCFNILTPAFPCQNTNANTSETTKRVMINEFQKFKEFTDNLIYNPITNSYENPEYNWKSFFNNIDFFNQFSAFLEIDILAKTEDSFRDWDGFVESRLIILIKSLEEYKQIKLRPFTNGFKLDEKNFKYSKTYFYGIDFVDPATLGSSFNKDKEGTLNINLRKQAKAFIGNINKHRTDAANMNLRLGIKASNALPLEIQQERQNEIELNANLNHKK
ncbi:MAG: nucleotidyltransferase domain-containing protein [archaeon]|nr:nucleotidyltransferase domain-containing protein [archaeon]